MSIPSQANQATMKWCEIEVETDIPRMPKHGTWSWQVRLRSALGRELRWMVCYFGERLCAECPLRDTCAYGILFQSDTGQGQRGVHPFTLSAHSPAEGAGYLLIRIRLFGRASELLPYVYYSIVRVSMHGVSRRIPFVIREVRVDGIMVDADESNFNVEHPLQQLRLSVVSGIRKKKTVSIQSISPIRIKSRGHYLQYLSWREFWIAVARRLRDVFNHYGNGSNVLESLQGPDAVPPVEREQASFDWIDIPYHSRSQKEFLHLGGVIGQMDVVASLNPLEVEMIRLAEVLHVGKNSTFGLGRVSVSVKEEGGSDG